VAIGMLPFCSEAVKMSLVEILKKFNLPYKYTGNIDNALTYVLHDKKRSGNTLSVVRVCVPGDCIIDSISINDFINLVKNNAI
jgi:3-dehydroquinate synthetase